MARLPRLCLPELPQHVIQRGNNHQACFLSDEDFTAYVHWLTEYSRQYQVSIHAWVLMSNHVHLLMTPTSADGISKLMQTTGRLYVRYFNTTYRRTGTLWEGRFRSCVVEENNYLLLCQRYIEMNPVRAGLVSSPVDYRWSSYRANGNGQDVKLWTPHPAYLELGATTEQRVSQYQKLFDECLEEDVLQEIRRSANKGLALGDDRFKEKIETLTGRRVVELKRGPKVRQRMTDEFLL